MGLLGRYIVAFWGLFFLVGESFAAVPGADFLLAPHKKAIVRALGLENLAELPTYHLDFSLSDRSGHFEGRGRLKWTNRTGRAQKDLAFLLHTNGDSNAQMKEKGGMRVLSMRSLKGPSGVLRTIRPTLVNFELNTALAVGDAIELEFEWEGWLRNLGNDDNDLFTQAFASFGSMGTPVGGADYGLLAAGDGLLTLASAYPMLAPYRAGRAQTAGPSAVGDLAWNQVGAFDVRIVTPVGLEVVTNLKEGRRTRLSNQAQLLEASGVGVRDFVMVASREFEKREGLVDGVRVRSWYLKKDREAGVRSFEEIRPMLGFLSQRYGAYPFSELDVVEATLVGGAGGVEFSGLVLMAGFLYRDPGETQHPMGQILNLLSNFGAGGQQVELAETIEGQRRFVLAHELAHQWAPSLVGTDAKNSPVVDEPLAQYLAGRIMQDMLGDGPGALVRDQNVLLNYALYRLLGGQDKAADRPTDDYSGALEYAALVYGKAPYFYVDLEKKVGRRTLDTALKGSVSDWSWQIAYGGDWLQALDKHGATGAVRLGQRWWSGAFGDADLGLDPEGERALELVLGAEVAGMTTEMLKALGMSPADVFSTLGALTGGF
jgi:hypothetical protein